MSCVFANPLDWSRTGCEQHTYTINIGEGVRSREQEKSLEQSLGFKELGPRLTAPLAALQARVVTGGVRFIARLVFGFHIQVSGRKHVPPGEPLIVAGAPHRNWIDGFLLIVAMPAEPRLVFLASENAARLWWRRLVIRIVGGVELVSTSSALNREALNASLAVLARGDRLAVLPEGWDHLDAPMREIGELRRGVAFIAQQSQRRVLPVALAGSKPLWRGKTLRVHIGAPIAPLPLQAGKAAQQDWTDELRATLQSLLPPEPPSLPTARRRWTWLTDWLN
jgi:1-acyl-sn-glycerol-3-phosphate acyltransferase